MNKPARVGSQTSHPRTNSCSALPPPPVAAPAALGTGIAALEASEKVLGLVLACASSFEQPIDKPPAPYLHACTTLPACRTSTDLPSSTTTPSPPSGKLFVRFAKYPRWLPFPVPRGFHAPTRQSRAACSPHLSAVLAPIADHTHTTTMSMLTVSAMFLRVQGGGELPSSPAEAFELANDRGKADTDTCFTAPTVIIANVSSLLHSIIR